MNYIIRLPSLYPWQQECHLTPKRHKLIVISRRAGKTLYGTYEAIQTLLIGKRVLWVAPLFAQVVEIYRNILNRCKDIISYQSNNKELRFLTKGQIDFRSADNPDSIRSFGYDLVIFDEMAFGSEEAWKIIRPTLVEGNGRFIGITTPNGFNFFQQLYEKMKVNQDWYCVQKDWSVSPHLTEIEINKVRAELTEGEFRQEFQAEFIQSKGSLFKAEWLTDIFVDNIPTAQRSCISVDLSLGHIASDWQAVVYVAWCNNKLYCDCVAKRMPVDELLQVVKAFYLMYKPECVAFESNGFQVLAAHAFEKLFIVPPPVILVDNRVRKETRISRLGTLLAQGQLKIVNNAGGKICFAQLADYPNPDQHDDIIDAIEMAWRALIET